MLQVLLFVIVVSSGRRVMMPSSTHHGLYLVVALQLRVCRSAANRTRFLCKGIHKAWRRLIHFISEDVQSQIFGLRVPRVCTYVRLLEHIDDSHHHNFFLGQVLFNVKVVFYS